MASPKKRRLIKQQRIEKALRERGISKPIPDENITEVRDLITEIVTDNSLDDSLEWGSDEETTTELDAVEMLPEYSTKMKKKELLDLAESWGVEVDSTMTKVEIIEKLDGLD